MAKPSQTFKKRQREHKLRERAQLKRERRQQRQMEKKLISREADPHPPADYQEPELETPAAAAWPNP